jgi:hypothetical protein
MRKQGKRRTVNYGMKPKPPMLVMRGLDETDLEIKERFAVDAFVLGAATKEHFFHLQDAMNLLMIAGKSSESRRYAFEKAEQEFKPVMQSIMDRFERTEKWGMSGDELQAMHHMISFARTFWMRQPMELLAVCQKELVAFYRDEQKELREQAKQSALENGYIDIIQDGQKIRIQRVDEQERAA